MCVLKKLKKKLHFLELISFLKKHPFVVFYYSDQENKLGKTFLELKGGIRHLSVRGTIRKLASLALAKDFTEFTPSKEIRRVSVNKENSKNSNSTSTVDKFNMLPTQNKSKERKSKRLSRLQEKQKQRCESESKTIHFWSRWNQEEIIHFINLLDRARKVGATHLIGLYSLEEMQKTICNCNSHIRNIQKVSLLCLGGIYHNKYVDHLDSQRLAKITGYQERKNLIALVKKCSHPVIHNLLITQNKLVQTLLKIKLIEKPYSLYK